jgi:hypothetical protein
MPADQAYVVVVRLTAAGIAAVATLDPVSRVPFFAGITATFGEEKQGR